MLKNKETLFRELNQHQNLRESIYVGKIDDIKKDCFDTENLFIAHLVHLVDSSNTFQKSDFKYIFEKKQYADIIIYKEIFSGAKLERIDLKKVLSSRGIYIINPISYDEYISNICSFQEEKVEETESSLKRVRTKA